MWQREERHDEQGQVTGIEVGYYVRSSVLGGAVVSELDELGGKVRSRVYVGEEVLAELTQGWVTWRHEEPATGARGESNRDGQFLDVGRQFDAAGVNVGAGPPLIIPGAGRDETGNGVMSLLGGLPSGRCSSDGMMIDCVWASQMRGDGVSLFKGTGSVYECATNDCGERILTIIGRRYDGSTYRHSGVVRPGDLGWDGALDGTYRRREGSDGSYNFARMGGGAPDPQRSDWQRKQEIATRVARGPITNEDRNFARHMVERAYDKCNPNAQNMPRNMVTMVLAATSSSTPLAAEMMSILRLESPPGEILERPKGDAGPAQLTTYWSSNYPQLIVGDAYGNWKGRESNTGFDGSVEDNLASMRNIVFFNKVLHGSFEKAAYWYGPGTVASPRAPYAAAVMNNYNNVYKAFFECIARELKKRADNY